MNSWKICAQVLAAALVVMPGCAVSRNGERNLSTSPVVPAAQGNVLFSDTKNDNVAIELNVKHLAPPEKLTPPSSHYVVWIRAHKDAKAQSIGELKVDDNLAGVLQTETPLHSFDLFVTAEASGQIEQPTGNPLLWTSYSR